MASWCQRAYILLLWFFLLSFFFLSFFSTHERTIWKIWSKLPRALTPWAGGKKRFLGQTLNFNRTYLCNRTWYQSEETCQSTGTPLYAPNLVNYGLEMDENGWRVFAHPLNFRIGRHYQPYRMEQANFGTCYVVARAYSLEQQNAGRAHAGLCHASSYSQMAG